MYKIALSLLFWAVALVGSADMPMTKLHAIYEKADKNETCALTTQNILKLLSPHKRLYLIYGWPNMLQPMIADEENGTRYALMTMQRFEQKLAPFLDEHNQSYSVVSKVTLNEAATSQKNSLFAFLQSRDWIGTLLQVAMVAVLVLYLLYTANFFSKKLDIYKPDEIKGSFDDIIGQDEIKKELQIISDMIRNRRHYRSYGIEDATNIIFSGPPGTGKTKMAGYFAKELGFSLIYASASNLENGFIGGGSHAIKQIHKAALKAKKAVIFLDEAQTLLMKRGQSREKWADDTTNTLLTVLDGIATDDGRQILWILASNFDDTNLRLDPALMRRFQKQINFRLPDKEERIELFRYYIHKAESDKIGEIDYDDLATIANNLSPAKIAAIVKEAAANAADRGCKIETTLLLEAYERDIVGLTSKAIPKESQNRDARYIATHELGHFYAHYHSMLKEVLTEEGITLQQYTTLPAEERHWLRLLAKERCEIIKISIVGAQKSEGGSLGYALFRPDEDQIVTLEEYKNKIVDLYGGLAAECVVFGESQVSLGAMDDLRRIKELAARLYDSDFQQTGLIEQSRKAFLKARYGESIEAITWHKNELLSVRQRLLEHAKLTIDEIIPDRMEKQREESPSETTHFDA